MKKILITNFYLLNYTGSELVALQIAKYFANQNCSVTLAGFDVGSKYLDKKIENLTVTHIQNIKNLTYDLIWSCHWPTLTALLKNNVKACKIVHCSLSPYEGLERLPRYANLLSLVTFNSFETSEIRTKQTKTAQTAIIPNPADEDYFTFNYTPSKKLKKIAFISNHKFNNYEETIKAFKNKNITLSFYGIVYGNYIEISPHILSNYDLIITIGRTVQSCFAMGLPVYNYGRFGGMGYMNKDNFFLNAKYNFSGRTEYINYKSLDKHITDRIDINKILPDIIDKYDCNYSQLPYLKLQAKKMFSLKSNMIRTINKLEDSPDINTVEILDTLNFKLDSLSLRFCLAKMRIVQKLRKLKKSILVFIRDSFF